ncbi:MAG TPA: MerR family transcriptional regulator [Thermoanaerobaculia bacterium]|nr:MerR family transcriptional regulator [Thermoanaerobaculia bacterium]
MTAEPVQPKSGHLWTSAEAARAFGVGVSSIKRWTDEGELESTRTGGGHRRYTLTALHRFAAIRNLPTDRLPAIEQPDLFEPVPVHVDQTLFDALVSGSTEAVRRLLAPSVPGVLQRAVFLDEIVADAMREIGRRWEERTLSVDIEHRATEIAIAELERLRPPMQRGRLAFLACPPGERHDVPLRMARLVFEWAGWRTEFAGADLPWSAAREAIERARPAIAAFSAHTRLPFGDPEFLDLAAECRERGVTVIAGGQWARGSAAGYLRFRTLRKFAKWLGSEDARREAAGA